MNLVLVRPRRRASQFVFTEVQGREAILSQTQKTAQAANPGSLVLRRRAPVEPVTITVDVAIQAPNLTTPLELDRRPPR